jgi:SAM-dependent methyltransferase
MEWNVQNYQSTCGRVTEHGVKLVNVLRKMQPGKVLDLGCGTGVLTNDIAGFSDEVIGVDSSSAMVGKAKSMYPEIKFYVMDACALQWQDYFDAVFSNAVLHFIMDQDALLNSVHKALIHNGLFICEFGASGNIIGLLNAMEQAFLQRGKAYSIRFYYPTEREYRSLLEKHGFIVESAFTYDLDTQLIEGEPGLRNWVNQIFNVEMDWFDSLEQDIVLTEIESALRPTLWDGSNWHLANRRLQVTARKK